MSGLLIENGTIYDGLGGKPYQTSLYLENGRIVQIGGELKGLPGEVIDAAGYAVTPGFVDIHRHCDNKPFFGTDYGNGILAQGITSIAVGNCGISMTPCSSAPDLAREMQEFQEPVLGPACEMGPKDFAGYIKALDTLPLPVNVLSMIGTGSVRTSIKGFLNTPFTEKELCRAEELIEEAMEAGACGISLGIMYLPEAYGSPQEFASLLKPVGRRGKRAFAHIRGEGDSLVGSVREILEIGRQAGCGVEISHFKSCGMKNWKREIHKAIALIEEARAQGQDVTCDFYPYDGGSTSLSTMLPPSFVNGDMKQALKRLGTKEGVEQFRREVSRLYEDWDNYAITLGWDRIFISGVTKKENEVFLGKSVSQGAKEFGFEDEAAFAAFLLHGEDGKVTIINRSMHQDDIDTVAKLPYSLVISDSIYGDSKTPHPRMYGAFPKIIREYVMERGIYTLEEGVKRMTSLPAGRVGLKDRGCILEGYYGDINIFRPEEFRDRADYSHSARLPQGLHCCILNGEVVVKDDVVLKKERGRNVRI